MEQVFDSYCPDTMSAIISDIADAFQALPLYPQSHSRLRHSSGKCKVLGNSDAAISLFGMFLDCAVRRLDLLNKWSCDHLHFFVSADKEDELLFILIGFWDERLGRDSDNILAMAQVSRMKQDRYYIVCEDVQDMEDVVSVVDEIRKEAAAEDR